MRLRPPARPPARLGPNPTLAFRVASVVAVCQSASSWAADIWALTFGRRRRRTAHCAPLTAQRAPDSPAARPPIQSFFTFRSLACARPKEPAAEAAALVFRPVQTALASRRAKGEAGQLAWLGGHASWKGGKRGRRLASELAEKLTVVWSIWRAKVRPLQLAAFCTFQSAQSELALNRRRATARAFSNSSCPRSRRSQVCSSSWSWSWSWPSLLLLLLCWLPFSRALGLVASEPPVSRLALPLLWAPLSALAGSLARWLAFLQAQTAFECVSS